MKFIDLFAGIGGFRYGLEGVNALELGGLGQKKEKLEANSTNIISKSDKRQSAYCCTWSNEWDKYAAQIYKKHYGKIDTRDIRTVKVDEIPDFDLLCAGFPCQSFSVAGKRRGFEDTRGTLFFEIARIAKHKRPRYLLLENVKGLLSHDKGKTFQTILGVLSDLGYRVEWQVLNSKHFGVPQNRERVFIIGHLGGESEQKVFPIGGSSREDNVENETGQIPEQVKKTQKLSDAFRIRGTDGVSATLKGLGGGMGAKTGLYAVKKQDGRIEKTEDEALNIDKNYHKGLDNHGQRTGIKHGMKIRRLTPTECERLQGFPDGWTEGISNTQRYKCLGNAVTTNVITAIGKNMIERLEGGGEEK